MFQLQKEKVLMLPQINQTEDRLLCGVDKLRTASLQSFPLMAS